MIKYLGAFLFVTIGSVIVHLIHPETNVLDCTTYVAVGLILINQIRAEIKSEHQ